VPTSSERKALLFAAAVLLLGSAVRVARSLALAPVASSESRAALAQQIAAVERAKVTSHAAKADAGSRAIVNINTATLAQLQTLPRVGPVLAERIRTFRDSAGRIGSLEELDKVKGIGPAMLKELAPRVTF
jgi:competence protein ComEA